MDMHLHPVHFVALCRAVCLRAHVLMCVCVCVRACVRACVRVCVCSCQSTIETIHKDVITSFSNFVCGMDILRAVLTQLLLYYTRLSDCLKVRTARPAAVPCLSMCACRSNPDQQANLQVFCSATS